MLLSSFHRSKTTILSNLKRPMLEKINTSFVSSDCCSWYFNCLCCNCRLSWSYYKGLAKSLTCCVGITSKLGSSLPDVYILLFILFIYIDVLDLFISLCSLGSIEIRRNMSAIYSIYSILVICLLILCASCIYFYVIRYLLSNCY